MIYDIYCAYPLQSYRGLRAIRLPAYSVILDQTLGFDGSTSAGGNGFKKRILSLLSIFPCAARGLPGLLIHLSTPPSTLFSHHLITVDSLFHNDVVQTAKGLVRAVCRLFPKDHQPPLDILLAIRMSVNIRSPTIISW